MTEAEEDLIIAKAHEIIDRRIADANAKVLELRQQIAQLQQDFDENEDE